VRNLKISIEEKLDIISRLEKGDCVVDKGCNVRFAYVSVHTICDNPDRNTSSAKSGTEVFSIARLPHSFWNDLYQKLC
jgi:hypothetical protein